MYWAWSAKVGVGTATQSSNRQVTTDRRLPNAICFIPGFVSREKSLAAFAAPIGNSACPYFLSPTRRPLRGEPETFGEHRAQPG